MDALHEILKKKVSLLFTEISRARKFVQLLPEQWRTAHEASPWKKEKAHQLRILPYYGCGPVLFENQKCCRQAKFATKDVCGTTCHEPPNSSCAVLSVFGQQTVCPACLLVILAFVTSTLNQVTLGLDKDFIFRLVIRYVLRIYFCVNRYGVVRINIVSL